MLDITQLSPAACLAVLKDHWQELSDVDLFALVKQVAVEFAKGSPDGEAFHVVNVLDQLGIKIARPYQFKCKCGTTHSVNK